MDFSLPRRPWRCIQVRRRGKRRQPCIVRTLEIPEVSSGIKSRSDRTLEATERTGAEVFLDCVRVNLGPEKVKDESTCARVVPVAETVCLARWIPATALGQKKAGDTMGDLHHGDEGVHEHT